MNKFFCCIKKPTYSRDRLQENQLSNGLIESSFQNIPNEILLHIFQYLSVYDLCNVALVCQSFKIIANHDDIWKIKCNISTKLHSYSYKQIYIQWIKAKTLRNQRLFELEEYFLNRNVCIICPSPPPYPCRTINKYYFQSIGGFKQHPNSNKDLTIKFSVNIDSTACQLIRLLGNDFFSRLKYQPLSIFKQMIERYYRFMKLKASLPINIQLIPTLDIEIVWQTHLIRPDIYKNDCLRLFHRIIDHSLIIENEIEQYCKNQAFLDTCHLYEEKFGEEYCSLTLVKEYMYVFYQSYDRGDTVICSYWDQPVVKFSYEFSKNYQNPFTFNEYDIIFDLKWLNLCEDFMHKANKKLPNRRPYLPCLNPINLESETLIQLKKSYERFLYMAAKYPINNEQNFIPLTYAIDIIYRSHLQEPLKYIDDCLRLVGYVINYNPLMMNKNKNIKELQNQIWNDEFQCEIDVDHLYNL